MKISKIITYTGITLAGFSSLSLKAQDTKESGQPLNVIYVFPDQMRNAAMGFWSQKPYSEAVSFQGDPVMTPNLDHFARESVVLTSAQSNCPLSSPHRGSLLTGMFPENSGVPINCNSDRPYSSLRQDAECISDIFSNAGYNCAYIGKLHVDCPTPNDPQNPGHYVEKRVPAWDAYTPKERRHGFDYWYSYGTYDVHKHPHYWDSKGERHEVNEWSSLHEAGKAIEYLRNENQERDSSKPFFMMISFNPPHHPYGSFDDVMEEDYAHYKDMTLEQLLIRPNADRTMKKAGQAAYYFAAVTGVDRAFGQILAELKLLGLEKNTIVVFSSDHGETMCSQGLDDPKNSPYTESMNVPFMVRLPEQIKPHIDQTLLLSSPDIMPTLLGLAGLENKIPKAVEGRNYAGTLLGTAATAQIREGALYIKNIDSPKDTDGKVHSYIPIMRGIKTLRYTLVLSIDKVDKGLDQILFFDDEKDPYQMNPLCPDENQEVLKTLYTQLGQLLKEANDPWWKEKILSEFIPY